MQRAHESNLRNSIGRRRRPRSVGVLIDLELTENAGGHVKCWQRIAEAAAHHKDKLDLTLYFLGDRERTVPLGESVRYVTLPPRMGTRGLGFLAQGAGHTDLAPYHHKLARRLPRHDVLHTTDVFAFGQTARKIARDHGIPLLTSIHTDLPYFTQIYTAEIVRRNFGCGALARFILDDLDAAARSARNMQRKVEDLIHRSDHVIASNETDRRHAARIVGETRVSHLRRGIDKDRFHPRHRNRARLLHEFGIPTDCPVLLFVGRIDATKNPLFAAMIARTLIDDGHDLRFLAIGNGAQSPAIADLLGPHAILPGQIAQQDLGWIYPSADIFVFPSESDVIGNVVLEAKAAGLPVMVSDHPGPSQLIQQPGADGFILSSADTDGWRRVLVRLISDAAHRRQIGETAHRTVEENRPDWGDVVAQDLLPFWQHIRRRSPTPVTVPSISENDRDGLPSQRAA